MQERFKVKSTGEYFKVPIATYICSSPPPVLQNTPDDIRVYGAGQYGFSYVSEMNPIYQSSFELDLSPSVLPIPLLTSREIRAKRGTFLVSWDLVMETTGVGINIWCRASVGDKVDEDKDLVMVDQVFFADLVDVNQYTSDNALMAEPNSPSVINSQQRTTTSSSPSPTPAAINNVPTPIPSSKKNKLVTYSHRDKRART